VSTPEQHSGTIVLQPGEGKTVSVLGDQYTYKAVGEQTGGAYGLVVTTAPPGSSGPPPHLHRTEDEALYVLEGELTLMIGDRTRIAPAGSFAFIPRGAVHAFSNPGSDVAKALVIISPAGFEQAFQEFSQIPPRGDGSPDVERLVATAEKYHCQIIGPPPDATEAAR